MLVITVRNAICLKSEEESLSNSSIKLFLMILSLIKDPNSIKSFFNVVASSLDKIGNLRVPDQNRIPSS